MKKRTITAWLATMATVVATATQITVGSYNIRFQVAGDTGVHSWDERKEYVVRTVIDNGFDIVGFNEVKFNGQDADLTGMLPQYDFYHWDGKEGWEGEITPHGNFIGFRKDKFDLLDSGYYFLNRNEDVWKDDWDSSSFDHVRHTVWAKLRIKGTDEIFYFFCTHLDHKGNIARMLQSHINYEKAWKIAGHYPTILVGDQNSNTSRVNYLNLYKSGFTDAFSVVEDPVAKFGSADPATVGQWNEDPSASRRIDYIWARGFNVDSYDHCTETYDLGAMPSDHIAITAKLTYIDPKLNNHLHYVAPDGTGNGSKDSPFGTIQEAVTAASIGDTIFVAAGDYDVTAQVDVKKSVHIFGGYDENFEMVTGMSNVKANSAVRCFGLKANTDVEMRNIGVYNGHPTGDDAGGILAHGTRLIMRDCVLADNVANRDGGGIDCTGQLILQRVKFLRNKAGRNGGGFCCDKNSKRYWFNFPVQDCLFDGNEAVDGSAAYLPRFVFCHISGNTFVNNAASDGSTLYLMALSSAPTSPLDDDLTVVNNTFALNRAAGAGHASAIYVEIDATAQFSLTNNTIVSNSSADNTAAVYIQQGSPTIASNIIACNNGGDVTLNTGKSVVASYNVYTTAESINYNKNARDIVSDDFATAADGLARVLDGTVVDGAFVPNLVIPTAEAETEPLDTYNDGYRWPGVPSIAVRNPAWDETKNLCTLNSLRLREDVVKSDFNFDCMKESSVYLTIDQAGVKRPLDGKATIGAREYVALAAIDNVWADENAIDANAQLEYFDLQGRRVDTPACGIFIRRQGSRADKVVIRR